MSGCASCENCHGKCHRQTPIIIIHGDVQAFAVAVGLSVAEVRRELKCSVPEFNIPDDAVAYVATFDAENPAFADLPGPVWDVEFPGEASLHATLKQVPEDYVIRQEDFILEFRDRDKPMSA